MRDEAIVKMTEGQFAEVLVRSREACHSCASRALCSMTEAGEARLRVLNPVAAHPGDWVEIEVPEQVYARHLIPLFGLLLLGTVLGAGLGTKLAPWLNIAASAGGALGFFLGAGTAGLLIWSLFRRPQRRPFPVITTILNHGGLHG